MKAVKKYEGSVYVGVVGGESENGECRDSIMEIMLRPGDEYPRYVRATKGYEARQTHLNTFLQTQHPFILLLDHDMKFPSNTLEHMRSLALPYVSGFYLRRRVNPMVSVWYENGRPGVMPMKIWTQVPEADKIYPIGASGWGCILMHRDVILGVQKLLRGEQEVLEDDMDLYPYDLGRIMEAVRGIQALARQMPAREVLKPAIQSYARILTEEIRPLRAKKDIVGSDLRFPFYARLAGFQMMGDGGVQCGHQLNYHLVPADYANDAKANPATIANLEKHVKHEWKKELVEIRTYVRTLTGGDL